MTVVSDTSALIALARLGQLHLLPALFDDIAIPEAVHAETLEARPDAPENEFIERSLREGWLHVERLKEGSIRFADVLGAGEREVIQLARELSATAIIDDRTARRAAATAGVRVVGTIGVLLLARRRGLIARAFPLVVELRALGFRISDDVLNAISASEEDLADL